MELTELLQHHTRTAVAAAAGRHSKALAVAGDALAERWNAHWANWTKARVEGVDRDVQAQEAADNAVAAAAKERGHVAAICAAIDASSHPWKVGGRDKAVVAWLNEAAKAAVVGEDPATAEVIARGGGNRNSTPAFMAVRGNPAFPTAHGELAAVYVEVLSAATAANGPTLSTHPEWQFGHHRGDTSIPARHLELPGIEPVQVNGAIDRLRILGDSQRALADIADYKTWSGKADVRARKELGFKVLPQVGVYALVLRQAHRDGWAPVPQGTQKLDVRGGFDFLKMADDKGVFRKAEADLDLAGLEALLANVVGRARQGQFPPLPHAHTCPKLQSHGKGDYCHFADVCRFRQHPGQALLDEPATSDGSSQEEA